MVLFKHTELPQSVTMWRHSGWRKNKCSGGKTLAFFSLKYLGPSSCSVWFWADQGSHSFFWKLIWHYSRTVTRKSGGRSHSKWRHLNWGAVVDGRGPLLWRWAGLTSVCRGCCLQPLEAPFSLSGASSVATCLVVGLGVRSSICCSWWFVWAFIPRLCCLWHRTALVGLWNTVISGYERVLGL